METKILNLTCPGCGAPIDTSIDKCNFCDRPIVITSFSSLTGLDISNINAKKNAYNKKQSENPDDEESLVSLAMCLLKLGLYEHSHQKFEKVIENFTTNSEVYFWNAISMLNGKRPFLHTRKEVDEIIENVKKAKSFEDRGIYSYFLAYIKYDYYVLKNLNIEPNYKVELQSAINNKTSKEDIKLLAETLKIDKFDENLII